MVTTKPLVNFVCPADLLDQVDTFRHDHRFRSRGAALVWLIRLALSTKPQPGDQRPKRG